MNNEYEQFIVIRLWCPLIQIAAPKTIQTAAPKNIEHNVVIRMCLRPSAVSGEFLDPYPSRPVCHKKSFHITLVFYNFNNQ